jgi:hypothetical protein
MTTEGIHHSKVGVYRLYIKRWNGERGLEELKSAYNSAIFGLSEYILQDRDRLTRNVTPGNPETPPPPPKKKKPICWSKNFGHKTFAAQNISINLNYWR